MPIHELEPRYKILGIGIGRKLGRELDPKDPFTAEVVLSKRNNWLVGEVSEVIAKVIGPDTVVVASSDGSIYQPLGAPVVGPSINTDRQLRRRLRFI